MITFSYSLAYKYMVIFITVFVTKQALRGENIQFVILKRFNYLRTSFLTKAGISRIYIQ